jgi:hypothetical protein
MWIRRVTITEQVAPTEFIGEVTGRNWNRYGTMRVTGELTLRLVPGGGATIQGRAQLLPGTGLYRHVKGRAGFHGIIADPNKPFNEDVKGWISYDKADGLSGP